MLQLFPAVFESVWKRKETKIFLSLALIFLTIYLASTFVPNTNFLQFHNDANLEIGFLSVIGLLFNANDTISTLGLIFLTYSVFRSEIDSHVFFLYKDINRRQIILAKFLSLFAIVLIFYTIFTLYCLLIYYTRLAPLNDFTLKLFIPETFWEDFYAVMTPILTSFVFVLLTAFFSMKMKAGPVLAAGLAVQIVMALISAIGLPLYIFPAAFNHLSWEASTRPLAYLGTLGISLIYLLVFGFLTLKTFDQIEF